MSLPQRELSAASGAALLLLAIVWGLSIPLTKLALADLPPGTLTAWRFAAALPFLFVFTIGRPRLPRHALPRITALGVLGIGVGQGAQALGIDGTTASVGTIISATIPVFVVILAAVRLKQAVTRRQMLGLAAAFVGIAFVALDDGGGAAAASGTSVAGAAWMLLSAAAIAVYYVWTFELTAEHGTAVVSAWSTLAGFLALVPWMGWELSHAPLRITAPALAVVAYLGILVTALGLFVWLYLLRTVPARVAAGVQYLQPVVGVGAAALMFGDALGALFALGVVLILGGLTLTVASR